MPRKITNKGSKKIIGKFPSVKTGKMVEYESQLERDYLFHVEHDRKVLAYTHQPMRLPYKLNGRNRTYSPDYLVIINGQMHMVEVKPEEKVALYLDKFEAIGETLKKMGFIFSIVTDKVIRVEPKLSNLKFLHRYRDVPIRHDSIQTTLWFFEKISEPVRIIEARQILSTMGISTNEFYNMMYQGILSFDMMSKIEDWEEVFINRRETENQLKEKLV